MLVKGQWTEFLDGVTRPVVKVEIELPDGAWREVPFLLDAGADRTVLAAALLPFVTPLLLPETNGSQLGGVGGKVATRSLQTRLGFRRDDNKRVSITGIFAIFTDISSTDICILGRDVTDNFDVIYSFPKREVLLLAPPHTYVTQLPF